MVAWSVWSDIDTNDELLIFLTFFGSISDAREFISCVAFGTDSRAQEISIFFGRGGGRGWIVWNHVCVAKIFKRNFPQNGRKTKISSLTSLRPRHVTLSHHHSQTIFIVPIADKIARDIYCSLHFQMIVQLSALQYPITDSSPLTPSAPSDARRACEPNGVSTLNIRYRCDGSAKL